jgi:serine/threonine protein kinase
VIASPVTRRRYRVADRLGGGGYGETYRGVVVRPQRPYREVAIKATIDQEGWLREAYFARLLSGERRVIQVEETFPVRARVGGRERPVFVLVEELAEHGDLATYLEARGRGYTPWRARREVMALLKVLYLLHGGSASHGDLSPANVLVCRGGNLKLADFGVARHALFMKRPPPTGWNSWFAPWGYRGDQVDDVYFMGQILAMLIAGDAGSPLNARQVERLDCRAALKRVIRRAIGPATRRYGDAAEMLAALQRVHHP